MNHNPRRLIEEVFPLKKVSEDSKHEKNVRHGHISTLHIWPARRPLAACRAAIIAALMPDPGDERGRAELCKKIESITRWKTENGPALDYFRREIRAAFGGRAPRVLDMFAGGGAIPLEAMRLGCDVVDYAGALSQASNPLGIRVARPAAAMIAETTLSPTELQRLADAMERLLTIAPELALTFRVILTAEGDRPSADVLARLNEVLDEIQAGWKLKT